MSKQRPERVREKSRQKRRRFTDEFKAEAVQMLLDGHSASSICQRLGLSSPNILWAWKVECESWKRNCGVWSASGTS
jgi:transposase